ncbi:hypothetical protein RRG08_047067 [Elysia crispata]|uniref:Uncharacterized protein n=1 Tax=Elysia crispata TaxID=231223 RepID=A0AAE1AW28_9GAST|nr:hypothetical protein RRG08_047067 [Elysia crispata]
MSLLTLMVVGTSREEKKLVGQQQISRRTMSLKFVEAAIGNAQTIVLEVTSNVLMELSELVRELLNNLDFDMGHRRQFSIFTRAAKHVLKVKKTNGLVENKSMIQKMSDSDTDDSDPEDVRSRILMTVIQKMSDSDTDDSDPEDVRFGY